MVGPPGSGKTMLATRLPDLLPPLDRSTALETTRVHSVAGLPLFFASLLSLLSLAAGIGVLLAPKSLLAVRGLASGQRRWAREWSRVSIAAPYRQVVGNARPCLRGG